MKTITSSDVQARFGEVLDLAKRDPVTVTQYGRPVVVMMGYEEATEALRIRSSQRLAGFLHQLPMNPQAEALDDEAVTRLVHEFRP